MAQFCWNLLKLPLSAPVSAACAIFDFHWSKFVTSIEVFEQEVVTTVEEAKLLKSQFCLAGYMHRIGDYRLTSPMVNFYWSSQWRGIHETV